MHVRGRDRQRESATISKNRARYQLSAISYQLSGEPISEHVYNYLIAES